MKAKQLALYYKKRTKALEDWAYNWVKDDGVGLVQKAIQKNFDMQGGTSKWPELSSRTVFERVLSGYPPHRPILIRSGGLLKEALGKGSAGRPNITLNTQMGYAKATFYLSSKKAIENQEGRPGKNLPKREFMVLRSSDSKNISKSFNSSLDNFLLK